MKNLFFIAAVAVLISSCTVQRAAVISSSVPAPMKTTTTVTSLDVSKNRISYTYVPRKADAKRLSETQLINNATYMALKENGNGDVLVKMNYYITTKRGMGKRVKSIDISGYPAKFVDFRQPTEADYKNLETFSQETPEVLGKKKFSLGRIFGKKEKKME